jgi:hypothetical protein
MDRGTAPWFGASISISNRAQIDYTGAENDPDAPRQPRNLLHETPELLHKSL